MLAAEEFGTMAGMLRSRAAQKGEAEAFLFVTETATGETKRSMSYCELEAAAARLATNIEDVVGPDLAGKRVLVAPASAESFVTAMFAVWLANGIPVPAPAAGRTRVGRERLLHIAQDSSPVAALVDPADATALPGTEHRDGQHEITFVRTPGTGDPPTGLPARPAEIALVQYTSGSTSDPKGVVLTHANLRENLALIRSRIGSSATTRTCAWLPLFHDMGLIGVMLHTVFTGGSGVLLPPSLFLKRPYRWLQLIGEERATATVAPNFGYQMCVDRIRDHRLAGCDLSPLDIALNGSEVISPDTVERFTRRFARYGFRAGAMRPCYGMAEASLLVSCADPGSGPRAEPVDVQDLDRGILTPAAGQAPVRRVVSCGPVHWYDIAIVDPDSGRTLPDRRIGEVWVRGASVSPGYWRTPADADPKFGAETREGRGGFLRTGDLGAVHEGELYLTGRLKDVLVVRGRNLYPHDLERELRRAHPALRDSTAAVFPVSSGRDTLVAVAELRRWSRFATAELELMVEDIRREVARQFEVRLAGVAFVRPGNVPRTSSGKVQHTRARELYEDNQLATVFEVADHTLRKTDRGKEL